MIVFKYSCIFCHEMEICCTVANALTFSLNLFQRLMCFEWNLTWSGLFILSRYILKCSLFSYSALRFLTLYVVSNTHADLLSQPPRGFWNWTRPNRTSFRLALRNVFVYVRYVSVAVLFVQLSLDSHIYSVTSETLDLHVCMASPVCVYVYTEGIQATPCFKRTMDLRNCIFNLNL